MEKLKDAMQAIADKVESIAYNSATFTINLSIILLCVFVWGWLLCNIWIFVNPEAFANLPAICAKIEKAQND